MLTLKTQFVLNPTTSVKDFLAALREWIVRSPHTNLKDEIPVGAQEGRFGDDNESATFMTAASEAAHLGGVRHEKTDVDQVRWVTDVVGLKKADRFLVSIQLNVDSELPVERLEQGKRPYIFKLLMQRFSGGKDGRLSVQDSPHYLRETDQDLAEALIRASADSVLPIVYVSRLHDGGTIIDPEQLARWLSGMAHVVVEPSARFSATIMRRVDHENVYGGAVAIYWPDGIGKWTYLPVKWKDPLALQSAISKKVRISLLYQRISRECTWSFIQELGSRQKIEALRESGEQGIDEYIQHFDREIAAKDEEIARLEAEVARLRYSRTSRRLGDNSASEGGFRLESGEVDLYQGEALALVIDALKAASDNSEPHSRRQHVLQSLIENSEHPGDREMILERLKEALRGYTSMTPSFRAELEDLNFSISDDGKHYKIFLCGDERYPFVLPKTGSDWRGGLNAFSDLKKKLF